MQFSREVIELMRPYPGREFKMRQLLQYATKGAVLNAEQRSAARRAVARVLARLTSEGHVKLTQAPQRGAGATYAWLETTKARSAKSYADEIPAL